MPVPKVPQQGDAARLTQLASGLKREHGTYGAVVQRNDVGRPTGSGGAQAQDGPAMPAEHMQGARAVAQAVWTAQFWSGMRERYPDDPRIEMYAANAERLANVRQNEFYASTPNYEY